MKKLLVRAVSWKTATRNAGFKPSHVPNLVPRKCDNLQTDDFSISRIIPFCFCFCTTRLGCHTCLWRNTLGIKRGHFSSGRNFGPLGEQPSPKRGTGMRKHVSWRRPYKVSGHRRAGRARETSHGASPAGSGYAGIRVLPLTLADPSNAKLEPDGRNRAERGSENARGEEPAKCFSSTPRGRNATPASPDRASGGKTPPGSGPQLRAVRSSCFLACLPAVECPLQEGSLAQRASQVT